jgi:hypothetical protein
MIQDTLLDLVFVAILLILGFLVARILLRSGKTSETGYLAFPLGCGFFSLVLFLISWAGVPITSTTVLALGLTLVTMAAIVVRAIKSILEYNRSTHRAETQYREKAIFFLLVVLVAISALLAVARSYSTWDAIAIWSIKGYGIAREGTIFAGADWGAHGLYYPQNIPLLIASFRLLGGDILPGSKLLFPLFYASLIMGSFSFWRHLNISSHVAGLGALFMASLPVVFEHSTIGYANLPFATYIALGCYLCIRGISVQAPRMLATSGFLFGLACWTRPEGIFLIPILVISLLVAFKLSHLKTIRLAYSLTPILVIGGIWFAFLSQHSGPGQLSSGFKHLLQSIFQGQFPWEVLPTILRTLMRHTITLNTWGFLFPVAAFLVLLNYKKLHPTRYPQIFALLAPVIVTGVAMVLFYVLGSFDGDLEYMMDTGMDRMFLPFIILCAAWMVVLAGSPEVNQPEQNL